MTIENLAFIVVNNAIFKFKGPWDLSLLSFVVKDDTVDTVVIPVCKCVWKYPSVTNDKAFLQSVYGEPFFGLCLLASQAHKLFLSQSHRVSVYSRPWCSGYSLLALAFHKFLLCLNIFPFGSCGDYTSFLICLPSPMPKLARQASARPPSYTEAYEKIMERWAVVLTSFYWWFYFSTWKLNVFNWKDLRGWNNLFSLSKCCLSYMGKSRGNAFG